MPIGRRLEKEVTVQVYDGIVRSGEKRNPTTCNDMDGLEGITLSEIIQTNTDTV